MSAAGSCSAVLNGSGVVAAGVGVVEEGPSCCCWRSMARAGSDRAALEAAAARPAAGLPVRARYSSCVARTTAAADPQSTRRRGWLAIRWADITFHAITQNRNGS